MYLDRKSLGAKEIQKDQHLAWNVKYAPGTIEARGFKDGKQVMVATRATTGPAAKLVVKADRRLVSANGEDVAVCVVEVQDAAGRILPVTENPVSFHVKGPGAVSGTGNGDPTNHEPDPGSTRKAFAGLCMAIVQSSKSPGEILVEATSPGLASASVVITSSAVTLRPQVPVWEREVPSGTGISGLWRPAAAVAASTGGDPMALAGANADMVFTFRQEGNVLAGAVDSAAAGGFGGGPTGGPIQDGVVSDSKISFRAGATTYTGTIVGDRIELARSTAQRRFGGALAQPDGGALRPAIGPPPDGTDPSFGAGFGPGRGGPAAPLVLRRAKR
ncbi:MAG: DUF4982 domain-containing protein [Paludibaculum sp.]